MTRRIQMAGLILLAFFSVGSYAWATDYSTMFTAELSKLRGTMQSASQSDRYAFHAEWMSRVQKMTPTEQQKYIGPGKGMESGMRMGIGGGSGMDGNGGGGM